MRSFYEPRDCGEEVGWFTRRVVNNLIFNMPYDQLFVRRAVIQAETDKAFSECRLCTENGCREAERATAISGALFCDKATHTQVERVHKKCATNCMRLVVSVWRFEPGKKSPA